MKRTQRIGRIIGKVVLAMVVGILMPVLVWVALGAVVGQKTTEQRPQRVLRELEGYPV